LEPNLGLFCIEDLKIVITRQEVAFHKIPYIFPITENKKSLTMATASELEEVLMHKHSKF